MAASNMIDFIKSFNRANGRGCPEYVLLAEGFKAKDIAFLRQKAYIAPIKGKTGGYYTHENMPVVGEKGEASNSLKAQCLDTLKAILEDKVCVAWHDKIETLLLAAMEETDKRKAAKQGTVTEVVDAG